MQQILEPPRENFRQMGSGKEASLGKQMYPGAFSCQTHGLQSCRLPANGGLVQLLLAGKERGPMVHRAA
jgi:hypothetical protein